MELFQLMVGGFFIVMTLLIIIWIVSVVITNASIIDPFWGMGLLILALWYTYAVDVWSGRSVILIAMVATWALRLSLFLFFRNKGKGEDIRYKKFREDYGPKRYWWVSFFQVFLLQGLLMMIVSLPLVGSVYYEQHTNISWVEGLGILVFIVGFVFEALGDHQLKKFKSNPKNKGKVLQTGVWNYTRHPNYFGESFIWWGFGIYSLGVEVYWPIVGSAFMMFLLMKVSGVTLLERTLKTSKPEYAAYIASTPSFFPWFPKSLKN